LSPAGLGRLGGWIGGRLGKLQALEEMRMVVIAAALVLVVLVVLAITSDR
jgi:hypothetical protein